jgi:hypothetical protein
MPRAIHLRVRLQPALGKRTPHGEHAGRQIDVAPVATERLLGPHASSDAEHRQRSERTELVLVDNASTIPLGELPASARIITLAERHSTGAARNVVLAHVSTPYVAFGDG